jgi:hypothetical protein
MNETGETTRNAPVVNDWRNNGDIHWIDHADLILKKMPENRSHADNIFLTKNLLNVKYFQELAKLTNP